MPASLDLSNLTMCGTYILVLKTTSDQYIRIGKLGVFDFDKGFYAYIGSAFGTGGLAARINHHLHSVANPRWHLDYLRGLMEIEEVWLTNGKSKHEHDWARILGMQEGVHIPVIGFGASDCSCEAHFFKFSKQPSSEQFRIRINDCDSNKLRCLKIS